MGNEHQLKHEQYQQAKNNTNTRLHEGEHEFDSQPRNSVVVSGVLSYELLSISGSCILACVNKNNVLMNLNCHQSNEKCFFPAAGLCGIVFVILQSLFSERNRQLRERMISLLHCEGMCWKILLSVSSPVTNKIRLGTAPERASLA